MNRLRLPSSGWIVFSILWLVTFAVYLPAIHSGKVGDYYKDWLLIIENDTFWNYLNRIDTPTLFQFTQLVTWAFYKLFGSGAVPWHIFHVTMHVACGYAVFHLFCRLLGAAGTGKSRSLSFLVSLLFCISAYNTEVVVHEPCFHYTLAFLMQLSILILVHRFISERRSWLLYLAIFIFILSAFSLEIFYITPWLALAIGLYECYGQPEKHPVLRSLLLRFFLPALVVFASHLLLLRFFTGYTAPHYIDPNPVAQLRNLAVKFPKYVFHILLMGRFWPDAIRNTIYSWCELTPFLLVFYALIGNRCIAYLRRFKTLDPIWKLTGLLGFILLAFAAVVSTKEFYQMQWVVYDRYAYVLIPFFYLILALLFYNGHNFKWIASLLGLYMMVNLYFLEKINIRWYRSQQVVDQLVQNFPDPGNRTVLLLNSPENMDGVLMIGSHPLGYFRMMYNATQEKRLQNKIYEVASFNMKYPGDGAHVRVEDDSRITVTLNQWGTWWWYHYSGASSYENEDFKVDMRDVGHWYELQLKKPATEYMLLYSTGGVWKEVDMHSHGSDQN